MWLWWKSSRPGSTEPGGAGMSRCWRNALAKTRFTYGRWELDEKGLVNKSPFGGVAAFFGRDMRLALSDSRAQYVHARPLTGSPLHNWRRARIKRIKTRRF
jgi:hypothetical protein